MTHISVSAREIQFDDVAVNDAPSYRRFRVTNTSDGPRVVQLDCSSACVKFQRYNENIETSGIISTVALFDEVNVINSLSMDANEAVDVLAVFSADPLSFSTVSAQGLTCNGVVTLTCDDQVERLAFSSRVYLSSMLVTPTELHCSMSPGKSQIMEFTVANASSKELLFVLRLASMPSRVIIVDVCENELARSCLGQRITLEPHEVRKFFLVVRTVLCEGAVSTQHSAVVQCDNLRDARNTMNIQVTANLSGESHGEIVSVGDTLLNFGDMYRGACPLKEVIISNVCPNDASVKLLRSKGDTCELSFCIDDDIVEELNIAAHRHAKVGVLLKTRSSRESLLPQKLKMDVDIVAVSRNKQQLVTLRCIGVLHTSTIGVAQPNINFGDTQVGQSKRAALVIENKSPLPGCAVVQLRSKIISIGDRQGIEREQMEYIELGGMMSKTIELVIVPQRVNPTYRKQLTVVNKFNQDERFIVNIEANNMAPRETKLHDELYVWDCTLSPEVQLRAVCGAPLIVPYVCKSKSPEQLTLFLGSTSSEIDAFILEDGVDRDRFAKACSVLTTVYQQAEEINCEIVNSAREELNNILNTGARLIESITLLPHQEVVVYARILRTATQITDFTTKEDGMSVRVEGIELPRFIRLSYRLCSTHFEVPGQRTKNFGDVNIGEKKTTKLSVVNKCKSTLFFTITKSRSVTAGHVRIGKADYDKQVFYAVVRPFATREVEITFLPGIKGSFEEKLRVTNVVDSSNDVTVTLKAQVTKVDTFDVAPESWSFGEIALGDDYCRIGAKLCVTNTSKTRREFRLKLEGTSQDRFFRFDGVDVRIQLDMEHVGASSGSSRKIEEQIEKLEQKLKIYVRKQKLEKIDAAKKRIDVLRRALMGEEVDIDQDQDLSSSEDEGGRGKSRLSHNELIGLLARDGVALPSLGPLESVSLTLGLSCLRTIKDLVVAQSSSINVMIFEAKDQEISKVVPIDLTLVPTHNEAAGAARTMTHTDTTRLPIIQVASMSSFSFLDAPLVPLHNTLLNDWTPFKVSVSANQDTTFVVLEPFRCGGPSSGAIDAKFKFTPRNGIVKPGDPQSINVECFPRCVGPQRYIIPVKNIKNPMDVKHFCVEMNPVIDEDFFEVEPKSLDFKDIVTPCDAGVVPARTVVVRSRVAFPLTVLVRSNKPSQIVLFRDVSCSEAFGNPGRIPPKGVLRVYAKYIPSVKANYVRAREFAGGIMVESIEGSGDSYSVTCTALTKVVATIGSGELQVLGNTSIDLGVVPHSERGATTTITVVNPSESYAIRFHCNASANVTPDKVEGYTVKPKQEVKVSLFVRAASPGLMQESVLIVNQSCSQDPIRLSLTAFKPDHAITLHKQDVQFPVVPVERVVDGTFRLLSVVRCPSTIHNHCSKDIILVAKTTVPVTLGEPESNERRGGGRVRVDAKHHSTIEWHLIDVPPLTPQDAQTLLSHEVATVTSTALVEVGQVIDDNRYSLFRMNRNLPQVGQCVLMPKFTMRFAMSEGTVSPVEIDVGTIGKSQDIVFKLSNMSKVLPLRVKVECEPTVRTSQHYAVEPMSDTEVRAVLDVDLIRTQGLFRYEVCFVNELNSENDITAIVFGRFYRRLFYLSTEAVHLPDEAIKTVTLPTIKLDAKSASPTITEMKLVVTCSEQNIVLNLHVDEAEAFVGAALSLQILRYDATDVADSLTFTGKPHHVRLRCVSSDESLPKLMNAFFGARIKPLTSIQFDDIAEVEKWKHMTSPLKWLGRIHLVNALTSEEEVDIFSTIQAVSTISVDGSKVLLKRVSVENKRVVFQGKVTISNHCATHTSTVVVHPCVSARCASVVTLSCNTQRETIAPGKDISVTVTVTADIGTEANVEQGMVLALLDESVVFSGAVVRFGIASYDEDAAAGDQEDAMSDENGVVRTESFDGGNNLELKNCTPIVGVEGSFIFSTSVVKNGELAADIRVLNASLGVSVEYQCHIVSQSPRSWLQLPSSGGKLKPMESHPLRLSATATDVGTFVAFVLVTNVHCPQQQVLVLRISCDVYVGQAEGLFDIFTPAAQRITTQQTQTASIVHVGAIAGDGTVRSPVFDIVNKANEPLEFQLNVMKPQISVQRKQSEDPAPLDITTVLGDIKLFLCLPQENLHQNYVVVDPKSRQSILFVAVVEQLHHVLPADAVCSVEVEIAVKCKIARDTHHIVKAYFNVLPRGLVVHPREIQAKHDPSPQTFALTIRNPTNDNQSYIVHYESALITLHTPARVDVSAQQEGAIVFTFNASKNMAALQREDRAIEEHFSVYRLGEPRDRSSVVVTTSDGSKPARPAASNGQEHEKLIHIFVKKFTMFMHRVGPSLMDMVRKLTALEDSIPIPGEGQSAVDAADESLLEELVVDAMWLSDEIALFSNLLRNSRTFASLGQFLANVVFSHAAVRACRCHASRRWLPHNGTVRVMQSLARLAEAMELLHPTSQPLHVVQQPSAPPAASQQQQQQQQQAVSQQQGQQQQAQQQPT